MTTKTLSRTTAAAISASLLAAGGSASALEFNVGETDVSVGGYFKADAIHNFDADIGDLFTTQDIPVEGAQVGASDEGAGEGQTTFHARETRVNFSTSTPTEWGGPVETLLEFDFFEGPGGSEAVSNPNTIRMRHAFVRWNGWMAGQYWSNFMPLAALPSTLDFHGPAGYVFVRQTQLRYTQELPAGNQLAFAMENPETISAALPNDTDNLDSVPDLTIAFKGRQGGLAYSLNGVVTFPEVEGAVDESTTGYGVSANAGYTFGTGTTIGGQATYVDGANRYLLGNGGNFVNAFVDSSGDLETYSDLGLMGYLSQPLSNTVTATGVVGYVDTDTDDETVAAGIDQTEALTLHANVQWQPVERLTYGLEYQWGDRELHNGNSNSVSRVQASAKYSF